MSDDLLLPHFRPWLPRRELLLPRRRELWTPQRERARLEAERRHRNLVGGVGGGMSAGLKGNYGGAGGGSPGIVYLGRKSGTKLGDTGAGISWDLTTLSGGDLGDSPALQEDDFVIVSYALGSTTSSGADLDIATPADFTQRVEGSQSDTYETRIATFYKFMTATPDSTVESDPSGNVQWPLAGFLSAWRYVDLSTPFDVADTGNSQASTVLCDPPSITPSTAGAVTIHFGGGAHSQGSQSYTSGGEFTGFGSNGRDDTFDVVSGWGFFRWSSGAFNPAAWTFSASDSVAFSTRSFGHALRPMYPG